MKKYFLIVILFLSLNSAYARDWVYFTQDDQGKFYYDRESVSTYVQSNKTYIKSLVRVVENNPTKLQNGIIYNSETLTYVLQCRSLQGTVGNRRWYKDAYASESMFIAKKDGWDDWFEYGYLSIQYALFEKLQSLCN
jgi:hypothetical protein